MAILSTPESVSRFRRNQLKFINKKNVIGNLWDELRGELDRRGFHKKHFDFLEIGGGSDIFTDRLLECYENSRAALLDNSRIMIEVNQTNPRKSLILADVDDLPAVAEGQKYHLIFMNFILNHCAAGNYFEALTAQREIIKKALSVLNEDGRIIVSEILLTGFLGDRICTSMIHRVTSSKLLAPWGQQICASTSGVGLYYLGENQWPEQFSQCGLTVDRLVKFKRWKVTTFNKILLTMKDIRHGVFVLRRDRRA